MGKFNETQLEAAIKAGIRAFHADKGLIVDFGDTVDPALVASVAKEVGGLLDWASAAPDENELVEGIQGEALLAPDPVSIRIAAYELALQHPNAAWGRREVHEFAAEIAQALEASLEPKQVETLVVQIKPDFTGFQDTIDAIFGRTEWRREGWNDLKAVLIRAINKQIANRDDDHVLRDYGRRTLEALRDFVASFQFDPNKP